MGYVTAFFAWMTDGEMRRIKLSVDAQNRIDEMLSESADTINQYKLEAYGDYKVEDDEAYLITNFHSLPENITDTLVPINAETVEYRVFDMEDVRAFVFPMLINNVRFYAFQAPRKETKTLRGGLKLFYDIDTFVLDARSVLTITGDIDCLVHAGEAVFHSSYYVQRIFSLVDYYREATEENIVTFTQLDTLGFESSDMFVSMAADKVMRRKIALLLDQGFFAQQTPDEIQEKARKIEPGIDILVDGHVHFPNDKAQCKHLLKMFCDEIYRGTFTNAVFETNSKKQRSQ